jgi:GxxExxY protein
MMKKPNENNYLYSDLTKEIISAAFNVFDTLGFGFMESVYEKALFHQLNKKGLLTIRQKAISVHFDEVLVGDFRADIIVEDKVIIEVKAVEKLHEIHEVQLVNYLKATDIEVGLLINFGKKIQFKRKIFTNDLKNPNPRL